MDWTTCIFCKDAAVAVYYLDRGCVCKTDHVQPLCLHHEAKSQPLGSMRLLIDWRAIQPMTEKETQAKEILEGALKQLQEMNVGVFARVSDVTVTLVWPKSEYIPEAFTADLEFKEMPPFGED